MMSEREGQWLKGKRSPVKIQALILSLYFSQYRIWAEWFWSCCHACHFPAILVQRQVPGMNATEKQSLYCWGNQIPLCPSLQPAADIQFGPVSHSGQECGNSLSLRRGAWGKGKNAKPECAASTHPSQQLTEGNHFMLYQHVSWYHRSRWQAHDCSHLWPAGHMGLTRQAGDQSKEARKTDQGLKISKASAGGGK